MSFTDWHKNKLTVGSFPLFNNKDFNPADFDYVINVSDEFYMEYYSPLIIAGCQSFWFPMNEARKDTGLNSIYGAICILWLAENKNKSVYLHCHAGINRSKCVESAYYFMRTGEQFEEPEYSFRGFINTMLSMCSRGFLPMREEMELFLTELGKQLNGKLNENKMWGGMLDYLKTETIKYF